MKYIFYPIYSCTNLQHCAWLTYKAPCPHWRLVAEFGDSRRIRRL